MLLYRVKGQLRQADLNNYPECFLYAAQRLLLTFETLPRAENWLSVAFSCTVLLFKGALIRDFSTQTSLGKSNPAPFFGKFATLHRTDRSVALGQVDKFLQNIFFL